MVDSGLPLRGVMQQALEFLDQHAQNDEDIVEILGLPADVLCCNSKDTSSFSVTLDMRVCDAVMFGAFDIVKFDIPVTQVC